MPGLLPKESEGLFSQRKDVLQMELISELFKQDISSLISGIFIILSGIIAMVSIIGKFSEIIGKPVRWIQNKNSDHMLLQQSVEKMAMLQNQQKEDRKQSIRHDDAIQKDLQKLTKTVNGIALTLDQMQKKENESELKRLKDSLVRYYNKYKSTGKWSKLEKDAFWDLFDDYESRGGDSYIHSIVEPFMRGLKETD